MNTDETDNVQEDLALEPLDAGDSSANTESNRLEAPVSDSQPWTVTFRTNTRFYFSIQHIQSAALFARQSAAVETDWNKTGDTNQLYSSLVAYAIGAVFNATAFLEALINELLADSVENHEGHVKGLDAETLALLAEMWKLGIPRRAGYPTLMKFQVALSLARKPSFDLGLSPFQAANTLVQLRNDLIHYEPAWVVETDTSAPETVSTPQLVRNLEGKFAPSPMPLSSFLKVLGHGCAQWSVRSSLAFADDFFTRMGLPAPYEHVRDTLATT